MPCSKLSKLWSYDADVVIKTTCLIVKFSWTQQTKLKVSNKGAHPVKLFLCKKDIVQDFPLDFISLLRIENLDEIGTNKFVFV